MWKISPGVVRKRTQGQLHFLPLTGSTTSMSLPSLFVHVKVLNSLFLTKTTTDYFNLKIYKISSSMTKDLTNKTSLVFLLIGEMY